MKGTFLFQHIKIKDIGKNYVKINSKLSIKTKMKHGKKFIKDYILI
jgi:hypothetical protein